MKKQTAYAIGGIITLGIVVLLALSLDLLFPPVLSGSPMRLGNEELRSDLAAQNISQSQTVLQDIVPQEIVSVEEYAQEHDADEGDVAP